MKKSVICVLLTALLVLTACGGSDAELTPTIDPNLIQTEAVQTFSAELTKNAPTQTPFSTLTPSATFEPFATISSTLPVSSQATGVAPTASCYQMRFVSDVTIPDNTPMTPGQTFTKTWKVKNTGSCAWDAGFKFAFVGGEQMSGVAYTFASSVAAGAEVDISVAMTAPNKAGSLRGNWRMSTAGGQFFGDEVYLVIVVGGATATNTSAPPTATFTATEDTSSSSE